MLKISTKKTTLNIFEKIVLQAFINNRKIKKEKNLILNGNHVIDLQQFDAASSFLFLLVTCNFFLKLLVFVLILNYVIKHETK